MPGQESIASDESTCTNSKHHYSFAHTTYLDSHTEPMSNKRALPDEEDRSGSYDTSQMSSNSAGSLFKRPRLDKESEGGSSRSSSSQAPTVHKLASQAATHMSSFQVPTARKSSSQAPTRMSSFQIPPARKSSSQAPLRMSSLQVSMQDLSSRASSRMPSSQSSSHVSSLRTPSEAGTTFKNPFQGRKPYKDLQAREGRAHIVEDNESIR